MSSQIPEQDWALVYFQKKAQFNQYSQLKSKSFQYQKILGKLHFLSTEDDQSNKKQIKTFVSKLDSVFQEIKNIFSEIYEEMKFLKFQNMAALVENLTQLVGSMHYYAIQDKKNKIQYQNKSIQNGRIEEHQICKKCLGSINQLNLKRLYNQITTTQTSLQDDNSKMSKQQRRKMISELDQYDIVIAQKQNYLHKVNSILQNKGKVGQLSSHDKTYHFLSEYLSKIQTIQEKRTKSQNRNKNQSQEQEKKWQQQNLSHILEYVKRVLFQHFVNQCSGPVKKIFQKLNIDKLFRSYRDQAEILLTEAPRIAMQNHQTQTVQISQFQQLRLLERKFDFKVRQSSTLKFNKEELEKKYIQTLGNTRKNQSQLMQIKIQKKWAQTELKLAQQGYKNLKTKFEENVKNFEADQKKSIQNHVNQRQRILRISKRLQSEVQSLKIQHSNCQSQRLKKKVHKQYICQQIQTQQTHQDDISEKEQLSKTEQFPTKRRKSILNKNLFTSFKADRRRSVQSKGIGIGSNLSQALQTEGINNQNSLIQSVIQNLQIKSNIICLTIAPSAVQLQKAQIKRYEMSKKCKQKNLGLGKIDKGRHQNLAVQFQLSDCKQSNERSQAIDDQNWQQLQVNNKSRKIKMSMTSFKKKRSQNTRQQLNQFKTSYKFSQFNHLTEGDQSHPDQINNLTLQKQQQTHNKHMQKRNPRKIYQVSQRLYKKKQLQQMQLPFERVIQNRKQKFYIKKISRQSLNCRFQKQRIKEISQILKPYMYNSNNVTFTQSGKRNSRQKKKSIRERLSQLSYKKNQSQEGIFNLSPTERQSRNIQKYPDEGIFQLNKPHTNSQINYTQDRNNVGSHIVEVQNIIESEYAYLKAVGFIDFIKNIGKQNKKMVNAMRKIQNQVKIRFQKPTQKDLDLFGGRQQAYNYQSGKNYWIMEDSKDNMMVYNKNDGLSTKIQKYFNLLKRANSELYGTLVVFLSNPIFAVQDKKQPNKNQIQVTEDGFFIKDLFNQLQKYHKIKHTQCTHIVDFLQKIGFYKYTYF